jgi:DNA-binding NarL/FixJ family response regulator
MQSWRVLVVEDDPLMREFFAGSVSRCAELSLAASVGTVAEARAWLDGDERGVDVLLTDLGLPDGSGLELIRHAIALNPACEPLVISMFGDEDNVLASIEAGALGYIHKDSTPDDIAQTILDMRRGASPISPMIARRVLAKYRFSKANTAVDGMDVAQPAIKNIAIDVADAPAVRSVLSPR